MQKMARLIVDLNEFNREVNNDPKLEDLLEHTRSWSRVLQVRFVRMDAERRAKVGLPPRSLVDIPEYAQARKFVLVGYRGRRKKKEPPGGGPLKS